MIVVMITKATAAPAPGRPDGAPDGVVIEGAVTGEEIAMPGGVAKKETTCERDFTVPYSFVDLNGHMNNTRYFDLCEDCVGAAAAGRKLKGIGVEYQNEARLGETLTLRWGAEGESYFLSGETGRSVFRMRLDYMGETK